MCVYMMRICGTIYDILKTSPWEKRAGGELQKNQTTLVRTLEMRDRTKVSVK